MTVTKDQCKHAYEVVTRELVTVAVHMSLEQYIALLDQLKSDIEFRRNAAVENLTERYHRKGGKHAKSKQSIDRI